MVRKGANTMNHPEPHLRPALIQTSTSPDAPASSRRSRVLWCPTCEADTWHDVSPSEPEEYPMYPGCEGSVVCKECGDDNELHDPDELIADGCRA